MNDEELPEAHTQSYPADRLFNTLSRNPYKPLGVLWEKAIDRVDLDPSGAITCAKSLLEATCKVVLERTANQYDRSADLPKLYFEASKALAIAPSQQVDQTYRSIFGSIHTIIQSVGELRNKAGDAHGTHGHSFVSSISEAELAVNLTGTIVLFLISSLESYLTLKRRVASDGRIILKFEKAMLWRLVDHARNSPQNLKYYDQETGPALWLVGDSGIYLMSNGHPRLGHNGLLITSEEEDRTSLIVHAEGCDPSIDEFTRWWSLHGTVDEGSDFCIPISADDFANVLSEADTSVVAIVGPEDYAIYPDIEFLKAFGQGAL